MSANKKSDKTTIENKTNLVEYLEAGCKPKKEWRVGTEHEKFGYHLADFSPLCYEGPAGIRAVLDRLMRYDWSQVFEGANPIALSKPDGSFISLEPAGQLELSGAPLETIHQTCDEVTSHLQQVKAVARELDLGFIGLGYHPKLTAKDMPWMPKGRYQIMRNYMPKKGQLGLEMMQSTCTVQVNLDFSSEADMVKMYRISMALQPVATALWANSPFKQGEPSGFLSYRSHIWTDTDPDRSGMLPFVFEDGFGFERYVDYLLDMPMYFVYRNGNYIDASGQSFRHFMDGKLPALPNEKPQLSDWINHISTAFPEVRLKQFMEMRGTDGGPWSRLCALPAFWIGLLYDEDSRDAAWDLIKDWSIEELEILRTEVPKLALGTPFRNRTVLEIATDALQISHKGLKRRRCFDTLGMDETHFLKPLFQTVHSGLTPADELLAAFNGRWDGIIDPIFQEYAY